MWASLGKELCLWVDRPSLGQGKSWGGTHLRGASIQQCRHLGEGTPPSWRGHLGCADLCSLQGSALIYAELIRCCWIRVWNGWQVKWKWGTSSLQCLKCSLWTHVVLGAAWLLTFSIPGCSVVSVTKGTLNNLPAIQWLLWIWQYYAAIKMIMLFLLQCQIQKYVQDIILGESEQKIMSLYVNISK